VSQKSNFNKYIIYVLKQCIHFTFKNNEINGAAAPAFKSENSPANPPHLTTAPPTVRKKKRMENKASRTLPG